MIFLWTVALDLARYMKPVEMMRWQWHFFLDFFLAASLAFFAILQAPNRFQTFYWRSAMATHFAPLVYLTAFAALLLMLIRRNESRYPAVWIGFLCLIIAFFGGGFSEPPDAVLVIASALALASVGVGVKGKLRRPALSTPGMDIGRSSPGIACDGFFPRQLISQSDTSARFHKFDIQHSFVFGFICFRYFL